MFHRPANGFAFLQFVDQLVNLFAVHVLGSPHDAVIRRFLLRFFLRKRVAAEYQSNQYIIIPLNFISQSPSEYLQESSGRSAKEMSRRVLPWGAESVDLQQISRISRKKAISVRNGTWPLTVKQAYRGGVLQELPAD